MGHLNGQPSGGGTCGSSKGTPALVQLSSRTCACVSSQRGPGCVSGGASACSVSCANRTVSAVQSVQSVQSVPPAQRVRTRSMVVVRSTGHQRVINVSTCRLSVRQKVRRRRRCRVYAPNVLIQSVAMKVGQSYACPSGRSRALIEGQSSVRLPPSPSSADRVQSDSR
jgi:hypothetical protein